MIAPLTWVHAKAYNLWAFGRCQAIRGWYHRDLSCCREPFRLCRIWFFPLVSLTTYISDWRVLVWSYAVIKSSKFETGSIQTNGFLLRYSKVNNVHQYTYYKFWFDYIMNLTIEQSYFGRSQVRPLAKTNIKSLFRRKAPGIIQFCNKQAKKMKPRNEFQSLLFT